MTKTLRFSSLLLLGAALAACSDARDPITGPPRTTGAPVFAATQGGGNGKTSLDLVEEDYDAGALDKENANRYRTYAVLAPEKLPQKYKSTVIGKDATESMRRQALEWDGLSKSTQQEILNLRANGFANLKNTFETEHFVLHYSTVSTSDAVPAVDLSGTRGVPDYIEVAARSWEDIWQREVVQLGYPAPKGVTSQNKFHVYYDKIPYYGYTAPTNVELQGVSPVPVGTAAAYIVVNNDFYGFPPNDEDRTGAEVIRSGALKVTQAHEFMHALQFNINVYGSGWLMESHATWAEDAVYDGVNDWHWYINSFLATPDFPIFSRYLYGAAYFQNYLSERYGVDIMRQIWLAHRTQSAANAIRNVAFGGSWEAMKSFAPAEYLNDISDFTTDAPSVVESIRPLRSVTRATHSSYPVSVVVPASTNKEPNRAPYGLGANFIDFTNASGSVTVSFDGTDDYVWRAFVIATPAGGGKASVLPITLDGGSAGSITVDGVGSRWSKLTLAVTIADPAGAAVPYSYGAVVSR
jgi:Family of unknown function (DUF6055)